MFSVQFTFSLVCISESKWVTLHTRTKQLHELSSSDLFLIRGREESQSHFVATVKQAEGP